MRNTMTNVLSHSLRVKPALTLSEQVNKLKKKYHLEIPDEDKAKKELLNKNYFDLINGLEELFPSGVAADGSLNRLNHIHLMIFCCYTILIYNLERICYVLLLILKLN